VGNHYEVTNGVVTKYYYAGSQRIAMRTGGTLYFMLGDHLGSTSLVTFANGNVVSETRYKAWGEVRYATGNTPTKYSFTGQYSYQSDFGLMFYNARWLDVSLGRFAQADSIIPGGVQGLDRYAYVSNSPLNYIDPSGHSVDCGIGDPYCSAGKFNFRLTKPSDQCTEDCYDAYLTLEAVSYQLGRPPSLEEIIYMTAATEYLSRTDQDGVREFGQEGLARNYYEQCNSDGCQGDELYNFLSAYEPWSDWKGVDRNKKTPVERAGHLVQFLDKNISWLWDDVSQILDISTAKRLGWTNGKWTGEPWQWFGPFTPSKTCIRNVTPYISSNTGNGTYFWMLFAEEDANFSSYCP
jgi:RHS repeat-associated protein